jgi:DNA-binding MarR family transcriptional regulator
MTDLLAKEGNLFLGSRLRRLGERMQADVAVLSNANGIDIQPNQFQLLLTLAHGEALTVGTIAQQLGISQPATSRIALLLSRRGLVATAPGGDGRQRPLVLTERGKASLARARALIWPLVRSAVDDLTKSVSGPLPTMLDVMEQGLTARTLADRAMDPAIAPLTIIHYDGSATHRAMFKAINTEWITTMFEMEPADEAVLDDPEATIMAPGGAILFVSTPQHGIVGTAALRRQGDNAVELTKMGVSTLARGLGAGAFLLAATISRGIDMTKQLGAGPLYLLTNRRCAAAVHLYESMGFVHDAGIMAKYGARYDRCDVAMQYLF